MFIQTIRKTGAFNVKNLGADNSPNNTRIQPECLSDIIQRIILPPPQDKSRFLYLHFFAHSTDSSMLLVR